MHTQPLQIRLATIEDLADIQTCARAAYAVYVDRMGREPAPMNADFASQIELGQVQAVFYESAFAGYVVFYSEGDHLLLTKISLGPLWTANECTLVQTFHFSNESASVCFSLHTIVNLS